MLKGFTEITVYGNVSNSQIIITSKGFKFNAETAKELGYPKSVKIAINAAEKKVAVIVAKEEDQNAVPFHCESISEGSKSVINLAFKAAHATVRQLMGWEDTLSRRAAGIYIAEEKAIVYDLTKATLLRKTSKEE